MKKAIVHALLVLMCCWVAGCKKETSIENGGSSTGNFIAEINGVPWAATAGQEQATITQGMINITGVSTDNQEISMSIIGTATGAYVLNAQTPSIAAYANLDSAQLYAFSTSQSSDTAKAGGTVTISFIDTADKTLTGTFSFNVFRTVDGQGKSITSGVFNRIPYTTSLPAGNPTDTVTAAIDGGDWAAQSIQASSLDGTLTIVGALTDGSQSVALVFPNFSTPGTYPLTSSSAIPSYLAVYNEVINSTNTAEPGTSGSITVLTNNTTTMRMTGNFQFSTNDPNVANSEHSITNGYFSVYYGQ
jgi:Family of unknown function (DUF6252)